MSFRRENILNYYLYDTPVENVFINEYMIDAQGDYVKVFLFALMYAEIGMTMSNISIAKQLCLAEEDVLKAWTYWENKGVIKRQYPDPADHFHYNVEFLNLKEQIYGKNGKDRKGTDTVPASLAGLMSDQDLKNMYSKIEHITGRLFEGKEPAAILDWIRDYGISTEIILFAYDYCTNKRKNSKHNYVAAVVKEWSERGFKSVSDIESYLEETDNRHFLYKRVLKALGFLRNPTEEEKRIMDTWFDDLGLDIAKVLTACKKTSGISNPNINYVNTILKAWSGEEKGGGKETATSSNSISSIIKSYDEERTKNETAAENRRAEVYKAVPRIKEIETELREIGMLISKEMLSGGSGAKGQIKDLKLKVEKLNNEKSYLLTDNNFKINYMDTWYTCTLCKDAGLLDTGERCTCFVDKLNGIGKKV
jgi:DnaD/phage-associated family protein